MSTRIDTKLINQQVDLLALAGRYTHLRRKANTGGGEYSGACPFCAGNDRFSVQPNNHIWMCRNCAPKWQDAISFGQRLWPGETFVQVCMKLTGKDLPAMSAKAVTPTSAHEVLPPYKAPGAEWQEKAMTLIEQYEKALWGEGGTVALDYLRGRGLQDDTIKHFRLGYRAFPRGVSIPCVVKDRIWYLKYRQLQSRSSKYICEPGSRPAALFNADEIVPGYCGLAVEGEFDTMLAWQEFGDFLPTFTSGSTTNHLDLATWGRYLLRPNITLILPDNDTAGESMAQEIAGSSKFPVLTALPVASCKDLTDYYLAGGDLVVWAKGVVQDYDPIPDDWDVFARSYGGVIQKKESKTLDPDFDDVLLEMEAL